MSGAHIGGRYFASGAAQNSANSSGDQPCAVSARILALRVLSVVVTVVSVRLAVSTGPSVAHRPREVDYLAGNRLPRPTVGMFHVKHGGENPERPLGQWVCLGAEDATARTSG
jgi:hypothetical protein